MRALAFDSKDNLFVLDGNNYRILMFDPQGRFVRKISTQGGGPGELLAPLSMTVTANDQIVVGDLGRRAYSVFTTDAERADASNPYNTYANPGLPIGPIGAPGDAALEAAASPPEAARARASSWSAASFARGSRTTAAIFS